MRQTQLIMGMPIIVELVGEAARESELINAVFDYFRLVDADFSTYKPSSYVSRINQGRLVLADCPPEVQEVFAACEVAKKQTRGYFNISHNGSLDPSGYVKGWAIESAADIMRSAGARNFMIEAGGDAQTSGHNKDGAPWRVGIRHPVETDKFAKTLLLSGQAIATSGTYERGSHIYNPYTGKVAEELVSLSVVGPSIARADVLATAAFAMGARTGMEFLVESGLEAYAITSELTAFATPGLNQYLASD